MIKPLPTWRNRRVGEVALAIRLDKFVIKNRLLQLLSHYRQWVGQEAYLTTLLSTWKLLVLPSNLGHPSSSNLFGYRTPNILRWSRIIGHKTHNLIIILRLKVSAIIFYNSRSSLSSGPKTNKGRTTRLSPLWKLTSLTLPMTIIGDLWVLKRKPIWLIWRTKEQRF